MAWVVYCIDLRHTSGTDKVWRTFESLIALWDDCIVTFVVWRLLFCEVGGDSQLQCDQPSVFKVTLCFTSVSLTPQSVHLLSQLPWCHRKSNTVNTYSTFPVVLFLVFIGGFVLVQGWKKKLAATLLLGIGREVLVRYSGWSALQLTLKGHSTHKSYNFAILWSTCMPHSANDVQQFTTCFIALCYFEDQYALWDSCSGKVLVLASVVGMQRL